MGTTIAALGVDLFGGGPAFVADMDKSARAVSSFSAKSNRAMAKFDRGMGKAVGMAGRFAKSLNPLGPLAGVAVATGLVVMTKRSLEAADAIAKTADAAGVSTAFLQENRHAAELAGVSIESMDKAFKQAAKGIGEARAGTGTLTTLLNKLDPSLLKIVTSAKTTDEAIDAIFDAMGKMTNQTDRMALSAAAFGGRGGKDMVNMLKNGTVGLRAAREEARALGLVLDEDLLRGAEAANDQLLRMEKVIGVRFTAALISAAPQITALAKEITDMVPQIIDGTRAFLEFIGVLDKTQMSSIQAEMEAVTEKIAGLTVHIQDLNAQPLPDALKQLNLKEPTAELELLTRRYNELADSYKRLQSGGVGSGSALATPPGGGGAPVITSGKAQDKIAKEMFPEGTAAGIEAASRAQEAFTKAENAAFFAIQESTAAMERSNAQTARMIAATRQGAAEVERVTSAMELENQAKRQGIDLSSEQGNAWSESFRKSQQLASGLDEVQRQQQQSNEMWNVGADALEDFARRGEFSFDSLKSVALSALSSIFRSMQQVKSVSGGGGLGGGFASLLSSGFSSLFSSGGGTSAHVASESVGQVALVSPFAKGGDHSGGLRLVGEKGPELEATGPSRIFNANQTKDILSGGGRGGGVTVINNIDARAAEIGVEQKIDRVLAQRRAGIVAEAVKASEIHIQDLADVGGAYARTLGRR